MVYALSHSVLVCYIGLEDNSNMTASGCVCALFVTEEVVVSNRHDCPLSTVHATKRAVRCSFAKISTLSTDLRFCL